MPCIATGMQGLAVHKTNHYVNTYSLNGGTRIIIVQMPVVDGHFDELDHHDLVYCSVELFVTFILPTASVT